MSVLCDQIIETVPLAVATPGSGEPKLIDGVVGGETSGAANTTTAREVVALLPAKSVTEYKTLYAPGVLTSTVLLLTILLVIFPSTASKANAPASAYGVFTKSETVELPIIFKIGGTVSPKAGVMTTTSRDTKALFPALSDTEYETK